MLSMRAAAALLSATRSLETLEAVVRAAFPGAHVADLDGPGLQAIGVSEASGARLASGLGNLRILLVETDGPREIRDVVRRLSRRLQSRAPHVLWLIAGVNESGTAAFLGGWQGPSLAAFVWEPGHVVDSDAETLCALAAVGGDQDILVHTRCVEVLGRDSLTRRFYRVLEAQVSNLAGEIHGTAEDRQAVALLYVSRLLFLCFLEAKGWLDTDRAFLANVYDNCMATGGSFHRRTLLPLFFGTLNTPRARRSTAARAFGRIPFLNGGLFTRTPLERRIGRQLFSDEGLGGLLHDLLQRFRFVAREDTASWSQASVDPEMLGRAFESLMESGERRGTGTFYTPRGLVERVATYGLTPVLSSARRRGLSAVRELRVLDPACGSGAFLVHVMERLAAERIRLGEAASVSDVRRDVLARSIFGVDRSPTAVWLCELRLWLSVVVESDDADPNRVPPLPNLDRNIRVGDAISGGAFHDCHVFPGSHRVQRIRRRYAAATGVRKRHLARELDTEERRRALAALERDIVSVHFARRDRAAARRARDLFGQRPPWTPADRREARSLRDRARFLRGERRRIADGGALPFSFASLLPDVHAAGGFDFIVGNPPWVRLHRIPGALRLRWRDEFEVFRSAPWRSGAIAARAAAGFASQIDLAALFVERSITLLRPGGALSLLLPVKLWRSLAGGGLRNLIMSRLSLLRLEDLSGSTHAFDATVYPSLLVGRAAMRQRDVTIAKQSGASASQWRAPVASLAYDESPGAPWIMLDEAALRAFNRVRRAGLPLCTTHFGAPRLGVKCGCNIAFLVQCQSVGRDRAAVVDADGERGWIEAGLLRPSLRGQQVGAWRRVPSDAYVIWTHDEQGAPLARLPAHAGAWLRRHYDALLMRRDAAKSRRWWTLFRVDAAAAGAARVVWADIGRRPRALVLDPGDRTVPLNTCYVISCTDPDDARALCTLINSPLAASWLNVLAEPARGGYRRYLGWTVGQLPIPLDWPTARRGLMDAFGGDDERTLAAALDAYGLTAHAVAPLLREL